MAGSSRFAILFTALVGAAAVGMGAFGAHGLKPLLEAHGTTEIWRTAALYHLVHSVALLALVAAKPCEDHAAWRWTVRFWAAGIVLFSGSLYALALGGPRWLGPVTPLGGVAMIAGWLAAGCWLWRRKADDDSAG